MKWVVLGINSFGLFCLCARRYYKVQWVNFYIMRDFVESTDLVNMSEMYNQIILNTDLDEIKNRK